MGVGTPTTLHSSETVPSVVKIARSSSMNSGALYAFGTENFQMNKKAYTFLKERLKLHLPKTFKVAKHEFLPLIFSAIHIHFPPSSRLMEEISRQKNVPSLTKLTRSFSQMRRSFLYQVTRTSVVLLISTKSLVRVPTFTEMSLSRLINVGGFSPADRSSTSSSMSFCAVSPVSVFA